MLAAIGDAKTCPHGHPLVEGAREQGVLLGRRRARRRRPRAQVRERGRGAPALPEAGRAASRARRHARELRRRRGGRRLGRRPPRGLAQRRGDGLGPRRPLAAAARRRCPSSSCCPATATAADALRARRRSGAGGGRAPGLGTHRVLAAPHRGLVLADGRRQSGEASLGKVALAHRVELAGAFDHRDRSHLGLPPEACGTSIADPLPLRSTVASLS